MHVGVVFKWKCTFGQKTPDVQWFTDRMESAISVLGSARGVQWSLSVCRLSDIAPQVANLREMAPQRPALALQPHSYSITLTWDQSDIQTAGTRACVLTLVPCLFTLRQNASVPQFRWAVCVCVCSLPFQALFKVSIYQWADEANGTAAPESARSSRRR